MTIMRGGVSFEMSPLINYFYLAILDYKVAKLFWVVDCGNGLSLVNVKRNLNGVVSLIGRHLFTDILDVLATSRLKEGGAATTNLGFVFLVYFNLGNPSIL
jgi:hypothetical protein